jgi:hypothetical protein
MTGRVEGRLGALVGEAGFNHFSDGTVASVLGRRTGAHSHQGQPVLAVC